ncbi:MAG: protein kinase [Planctomycetota bacterium]
MQRAREDHVADLFDLHARFAADRARGGIRSVEDYVPLFPGLEAEVRAAHAAATAEHEDVAAESAPAEPPEPERRFGHYRLLRELGRGGQGAVHLAEDSCLGRKVALKMLTGIAQFSSDARKRFQREAETTSRLDHPAICTVYESGFEGELAYIAMRYVEGESLARRLARVRSDRARSVVSGERAPCAPLDRAELAITLRFFEEAARGLHAAHEAGVIHRDVKPGNLMLSSSGAPVLLDFGLARATESTGETITNTGDQLGTPSYMSPEQVDPEGRALDRRTDVYSLGATLYECLTLEPPFETPTLQSLYQAILREPVRDPRPRTRSIPRELVTVLETALEKDRDRRYTTALDFAEDLRRVREFEPIRARPASLGLRMLRWVQRNPAHTIGIAAFVVIVALGWVTRVTSVDLAQKRQLELDRVVEARLLDLLAETPMRGGRHDWAAECRNYLRAYAEYGLDLESPGVEERATDVLSEARARSDAHGGDLAESLLDGFYRMAWTIDEARSARRPTSDAVQDDLGSAAARGPQWEVLHARLLGLVDLLETSGMRRDAWRAHRAFVESGADEYDALIASARGSPWSAAELIRLSELVYLARRDGTALELLDLAEKNGELSPAQRFTLRLERGVLRLEQGDAQKAQVDLDVARELRPGCAATYLCLADAWWKTNSGEKALAFARVGARLASDNPNMQSRFAAIAATMGVIDEAESAAREAHRLAPSDPTPLRLLGDLAMKRGDAGAAVESWGEAADLEPSQQSALWRAAGRCLRRERGAAANASFVRGLGLSARESAWTLAGGAQSARTSKDAQGELELLEAAHEDVPEDADVARELGRALFESGRHAQAVDVLRAAIARVPSDVAATVTLGRSLLALGEKAEAVRVLSDALASEPDAEDADELSLALTHACIVAGDLPRAEDVARKCVESRPEALEPRRVLADLCEARGDTAGALEQLYEVLRLSPTDTVAFEKAARLVATSRVPTTVDLERLRAAHPANVAFAVLDALDVHKRGDLDGALSRLDTAATLDTGSVLAPLLASDLCIVGGRLPSAIEQARVALRRKPDSVPARVLLSRALRGAGRFSESVRTAEEALDTTNDDPSLFAEWVESALLLGLHAAVIERGNALVARDEKRMDGWVQLSRTLRLAGDLQAAEAVARRVLERRPGDRSWHEELANVLFEAQRWEACMRAFEDRGRLDGLTSAQVSERFRRHAIANRRARASESESTEAGRAELDRRTAIELAGLGRFRRAAAAFAREAPPADFQTSDAERWVSANSGSCARAALEAWNLERDRGVHGAPVEAGAGSSVYDAANGLDASAFANRALDLLEARLERRTQAFDRELDPARRGSNAAQLEAELSDPDLVAVRFPPDAAPWTERARSYTWRVRELLAAVRRGGP